MTVTIENSSGKTKNAYQRVSQDSKIHGLIGHRRSDGKLLNFERRWEKRCLPLELIGNQLRCFFWCNRQEENAEATSEHNVFNSPLLVGDLFRILRRPGGSGQGERSTGL